MICKNFSLTKNMVLSTLLVCFWFGSDDMDLSNIELSQSFQVTIRCLFTIPAEYKRVSGGEVTPLGPDNKSTKHDQLYDEACLKY